MRTHEEIRAPAGVMPPVTAPRCPFHVGQEMQPVEVRRFNYSWVNENDSARHGRKKRVIWKCPIAGCPCVTSIGEDDGEALDD